MFRGPIKMMQYTSDHIHLQDTLGLVPICHQDSKNGCQRKILAGRDFPSGKFTIKYKAMPWDPTEKSPCGPQITIGRDGGGLTGAGMSFIPRPAIDTVMEMAIEWDLSSTPLGTRAACSLGEGKIVLAQIKPEVLDEDRYKG